MDKYVRVLADYCADPVWEADGCMMMMMIEELPVTEDLRQRLVEWNHVYERKCPSDGITWPEQAQHAAQGLELAKQVKQQLPDWTVVYSDSHKLAQLILSETDSDDRTLWENEVTLD